MPENTPINTPEEIAMMCAALSEVCGARRYELTPFEMKLWMAIIENAPCQAFMNFLQHHALNSNFAPTVKDANDALGLNPGSEQAWNKLIALVASVGPYNTPKELDDDHLLRATVLGLGGWVKVNETLPDVGQDFAMKTFRQRFEGAYNTAITQVKIRGEMPAPLMSLSNNTQPAPLLQAPMSQAVQKNIEHTTSLGVNA